MAPCPSTDLALLESMAQLFALDGIDQALAIALAGVEPGQHVDVAVHPLPADDPVGALYGFTAPGEWLAFGIAANATAKHRDGRSDRVRIVYLVDRSGRTVHAAHGCALESPASHAMGRVPDLCRRVLGLPTAPPVSDPARFWDIDWLDRVLAHRLGADLGEPPPSWADLVALRRHRDTTDAPWAILRRECAAGTLDVGVPADLAAWFDDGMFEREVLARYPDPRDMLADLDELLAPVLMRRLRAAL